MPPSDQCPGNGHGGQQLKGPAALPCRLSRLRNIGQRQCRRHGISLLLCPARPPRIASAPGSLQANGSHSCCVQTPDSMQTTQRANRHPPDLDSHRMYCHCVQSLVAVGLFGCPSPLASRCHPGAPSPFTGRRFRAIFCCGGCADAQPSPPEKEAVRSSKIQVSAMGAGAGVVCTWTARRVPLKQIARGESNRICPIVSPGPRDRRPPAMATLPTLQCEQSPQARP